METTELPPDDRPPVAPPRRVSRGLLVAAALATVVLAIATFMAFRSDGPSSDVAKLDPDATLPSDQLIGGGGLTGGRDVTGQQLPALDYTLFDGGTAQLTTGGKPLVINFWASTCGPCVAEMPAIEAVYQTNGSQIGVLGLQVQEAADLGRPLLDRTGVTYPVGRDPQIRVFRALGGANLPTTVLVRADGTIAAVHTGALTADQLQGLIDTNLKA